MDIFVRVVEYDQAAEFKVPGSEQASWLMPSIISAFAAEDISEVIEQFAVGGVETLGEHSLRDCHSNGVGETLAERSGCCFDADCVILLRVSGGFGA